MILSVRGFLDNAVIACAGLEDILRDRLDLPLPRIAAEL